MTAAIAVELAPADVASPYAEALLDSCNIGMQQRATCVLGPDAATEERNIAVAIVSWKGSERLEARIEVGLRARGAARWQARAVVFAPGDPEVERWRALGFAVATLVEKAIGAASDTPDERSVSNGQAPVVTQPSVPTAEDTVASRSSWTGFSASGKLVVETGVPGHLPALGGAIVLEQGLGDRWFFAGEVGLTRQSLDVDHIDLLRPRASAGGGVILVKLGDRARLAVRLAVALELIQAAGRDPIGGASDQGTRWIGGIEQGVDGVWMWSNALGMVLGAAVRESAGSTQILAHGTEVALVPAVDWAGSAGVRLAFP